MTTKLKHNNCNHRSSLGLETPRVDSPFEAFVSFVAHCLPMIFKQICLKCILRKSITQTHVQHQKLWSEQPKLAAIKVKLATYRISDKESAISATMQPLWNETFRVEHPTTLKHRNLMVFSDFETAEHSTLSTKSESDKLESQLVQFER